MSAPPAERPELKIRPAPKIWEKPKRKRGPEAKLERSARAAEAERGSPILGAILLLGCSAALVVLGGPRGPDPHLTRAKVLIERYEELRAPGVRDYENAAYRSAQGELDQVSLESRSGTEAAALAQEIRARVEAQRAAARSRSAAIAARQEHRQSRDEEFFEAAKRSRLVQGGGEHEECEAESSSHPAHHDHEHHGEPEPHEDKPE